jgi:hypothetical protein
LGGTPEELYAITEKYLENPMVIEDHGNHICVYILSMDKSKIIAIDVRTLDLKTCLYFFELVDGMFGCVWTNPEIEKQEKEALKNRGGVVWQKKGKSPATI